VRGPELAFPEWLALREPADAAARSDELVEQVRAHLPRNGALAVHDLGCGTGSMARWLAGRLPGPQHWVMYDRDGDLLSLVPEGAPSRDSDGGPVCVETRRRDITRLQPGDLAGAGLVTASAVLDTMTAAELDRLVATCAEAGCPALIALTVSGRVDITPDDPLDVVVMDAFNTHQRRSTNGGPLRGPDAVDAARRCAARSPVDVMVRPSPWRLGATQAELSVEWFAGWVGAAVEQRPELHAELAAYAQQRRAAAAAGRLSVMVHHEDLLALPG